MADDLRNSNTCKSSLERPTPPTASPEIHRCEKKGEYVRGAPSRIEKRGDRQWRERDEAYDGLGAEFSSMPLLWLWIMTLPLRVEVEECFADAV